MLLPTPDPTAVPWSGRAPDVAVNLHGTGPQSHRALEALEPRRRIGFRCPAAGPGWEGPDWDAVAAAHPHERARWCALLQAVGIPADPADLRLPAPSPRTAHRGPAAGPRAPRRGLRREAAGPPDRFAPSPPALDGHRTRPGRCVTGSAAPSARSPPSRRRGGPGSRRPGLAGRTDLGAAVRPRRRRRRWWSAATPGSRTWRRPTARRRWCCSARSTRPSGGRPPTAPHVALAHPARRRGARFADEPDPALLAIGVEEVLVAARRGACASGSPSASPHGDHRPARALARSREQPDAAIGGHAYRSTGAAPDRRPVRHRDDLAAPRAHERGLGQVGRVVVAALDPEVRAQRVEDGARVVGLERDDPVDAVQRGDGARPAPPAARRRPRRAAGPTRRSSRSTSRQSPERAGGGEALGVAAAQRVEHPAGRDDRPARGPDPRDERARRVEVGDRCGRRGDGAPGWHHASPTRRTAAPPPRATNSAAPATASATASSTVAPAASRRGDPAGEVVAGRRTGRSRPRQAPERRRTPRAGAATTAPRAPRVTATARTSHRATSSAPRASAAPTPRAGASMPAAPRASARLGVTTVTPGTGTAPRGCGSHTTGTRRRHGPGERGAHHGVRRDPAAVVGHQHRAGVGERGVQRAGDRLAEVVGRASRAAVGAQQRPPAASATGT